MDLSVVNLTFDYITKAPFFWVTMGMVTSVSMFVGAIIFDGDLSTASKGAFGLLSYIFFLIQVQITRVKDTLEKLQGTGLYDYMGFASTMTIIIVTFFWLIGVFLGVLISWMVRKSKKGVKTHG